MKAIWAVACTVLVVAGAFVLGGGCASTKSQMNDFSSMEVGEGPGSTLRRLTELQKDTGSQPAVSPPAQQASPVSPPAAVTTPKASLEKNPMKSDSASSPSASFRPKSLDASSPKKNKNLPASAERYLSSLDSVSSSVPPGEKTAKEISQTTVSPKVPPAKPPEPSNKEVIQSNVFPQSEIQEKQSATGKSIASSTAPAMEPPVSDARTEKNPIPPAPASTAVPPSEKPENLEKAVSMQASAAKIPPAVPPQSSPIGKAGSSASSQYRIGPEDVLNVSVWGDKELTMDVIVRPDGKISLPLVQDIQAEGLTASELSDTIHQKLRPFIKDPNVSVIVKQINSPKFSVMGYVGKPGTYPLRGDVTVLEALSMAGGFTPFASPRKIKLVRNADGKQEIRVVNYYDMIDKGGKGNYLLKAGDIIVVP